MKKEDIQFNAIGFLRGLGILKDKHTEWIVQFSDKSSANIVEIMETYAKEHNLRNASVPTISQEHADYLEACKGQSLLDVKLATEHKNACLHWERAMMNAIGEDGVGSVVNAIRELKDKAVMLENYLTESRAKQRRELYASALVAYCSASNAVDTGKMKKWADTALQNFDEQFPNPIS